MEELKAMSENKLKLQTKTCQFKQINWWTSNTSMKIILYTISSQRKFDGLYLQRVSGVLNVGLLNQQERIWKEREGRCYYIETHRVVSWLLFSIDLWHHFRLQYQYLELFCPEEESLKKQNKTRQKYL